jgi:thiol-disulfide isomerase/thioredoxin
MKKIRLFKLILLIGICTFCQIDSFGQYSSLKESPMFKNGKQNVFKDSITNILYNISFMDSLYKSGKSPFQVFNNIEKGDTVIWLIKFFNEEEFKRISSIKAQWLNKEFPLKDFTDIQNIQIKSNDLHGKILIINCWSITCGPCIKEMPYLNNLKDSLNSDKYIFLGITFDDAASITNFFKSDKLKKYLNNQNPSFNFRIIPNQETLLNNILGIKSYPTTFIVDQKGIIKQMIEGLDLDAQKNPKVYSEIMDALKQL